MGPTRPVWGLTQLVTNTSGTDHRYGGREDSGGTIGVSRHLDDEADRPVRPAGSGALLLGLALSAAAAGTCAALPLVAVETRPAQAVLWTCAGALALAAGLLARSR